MPTVKQLIDDIDATYPRATLYTFAQKVGWMNDIQRKIHAPIPYVQEFLASSSCVYDLSTSLRLDKIDRVLVSDSTAIAAITTTNVWTTYKYAGPEDELTGNQYFRPDRELWPTTSPSSQIALYPNSTEKRVVRIYGEKIPATITATSSDTTSKPDIDEEYHDIYKYGVKEIVAKSGESPDFNAANNFHADYLEELKRIRKDTFKRKEKVPKKVWSYREW